MSASTWWNDSFAIRRQIKALATTGLPVEVSDSLYVIFDYATMINSHKIRSDLQDIQVMYFVSQTSTWLEVPFEATLVDTSLVIEFNVLFEITTQVDDNYYVYMANPQLNNMPDFDNDFLLGNFSKDTWQNGLGLSFTRPTDDWVKNPAVNSYISQVVGAKAAFTFNGVDARLVLIDGPSRGILQLTVDDQDPIMIDTYKSSAALGIPFQTSGLTIGDHYIRITATGDKNPSSSDSKIEIVGFQYSNFIQAIDLGEEIDPIFIPIRIMVGP